MAPETSGWEQGESETKSIFEGFLLISLLSASPWPRLFGKDHPSVVHPRQGQLKRQMGPAERALCESGNPYPMEDAASIVVRGSRFLFRSLELD